MNGHVIPLPSYCLINIHETERDWHFAGTFSECWDRLVSNYGMFRVRTAFSMGWRIAPVRLARQVREQSLELRS